MKKILTILLLGMFLISLASAFEFDNTKTTYKDKLPFQLTDKQIPYNNLWNKYPPIEIKNSFGLGKTLFKGAITEHTETCGINCYSNLEIEHSGGVLIQNIDFYTIKDDKRYKQDVRSFQWKRWGDIDDYKNQCSYNNLSNGTKIKTCNNIKIGSHKDWINFEVGEELPKGTYNLKLEAKKKPSRTIDWVIKTHGEILSEWAVWGNISQGDDAEVRLIKPNNNNISDNNNINFICQTNITNGASIINLSLWTNKTTFWEINNYSIFPKKQIIGLTNYYRMDSPNTPIRDYINFIETNLTAYNSPTTTTGKINNSINFNGVNTYLKGDTNPTLGISNDYSISTWVKSVDASDERCIMGQYISSGSRAVMCFKNSKASFGTWDGSSAHGISSTNILNDNTWYHIYITHYGTNHTNIMWLNGVKQTGGDQSLSNPGNYKFYIGQRENNLYYWEGLIDEFAIFNYSSTITEAQEFYNSDNAYRPSPLSINITKTWENNIFNNIIWNVQACDSDGDCGFATSNYSLYIDKVPPQINIEAPTGIFDTLVEGLSLDLNYTINDTNLDSCWYEYNETNTTITDCSKNTTFNYAFGKNEIIVYANDSVGNINNANSNWNVNILENSQTYNTSILEGIIQNFYANLTISSSIDISSANLIYGDNILSSSISSSGQERVLGIENFETPQVSSETNVSFYWNIILNNSNIINLTTRNQTVKTLKLDDCNTYNYVLFNLSLLDEETLNNINGTIELNYYLLNTPNYNIIENLTGKFENVSNTLVCSENNLSSKSLLYSAEIRYYATNYTTKFYNIQKGSITEVQKINLYDLKTSKSTEFKIEYQDSDVVKVSNAIIQLQKKYLSENIYKVVEAPLTSDEGTAITHIDLNTNLYKVTVVKNGEVLDTFNNVVFVCDNELAGTCSQKLYGNIDPQNSVSLETLNDFTYSISQTDNKVSMDFSIPSGIPKPINFQLNQLDSFGNETLCNKTVISSAGSIECSYEDTIGDSYLTLTVSKDGEPQAIKTYIIPEAGAVDFLGNNYFIVFIFMLSIIGMAITSPEWIIVNSIIVLMLSGILYLLNGLNFVVGLGEIMWLIIAGGILIMKIAKQEDR